MSTNAKQMVHRWFDEVWNNGREDTIDELFAANGVTYGLGEIPDTHGPQEFKVFFRNLRETFPDIHIAIQDSVAEGDKVAVRVEITGTHLGNGLGIPATGKKISVQGICVIHAAGGKLVAGWNSWDQLGLLRQLGAIPTPPEDRFLTAKA